jgi:hypothetical protein
LIIEKIESANEVYKGQAESDNGGRIRIER